MSAESINQQLLEHHPAAYKCLSKLGKRLYFPKGVPVQAAEASDCRYNATIGQVTDDSGAPTPLPSMSRHITGLTLDEVFLYSPQGGRKDLRQQWHQRLAEEISLPLSLPVVCAGLTHGLSIASDLFVDPGTNVFLPNPRWGNYDHIFSTRADGNIIDYCLADPTDGYRFSVAELRRKLQQRESTKPALLVLNIPSNPSGYSPTLSECQELVQVISEQPGPLVIVLDEAYKDMVWQAESPSESLINELGILDSSRFLLMKIDGATKELFFFGGRVAFVSFAASFPAARVLEEKLIASTRSTVSAMSSPAQAMVLSALRSPTINEEQAVVRQMLQHRYKLMKQCLSQTSLEFWPFNSAFFLLIAAPAGAEYTRKALLAAGVGTVAFASANAIRLSYSTVPAKDIPSMVKKIDEVLAGLVAG